MSIKFNDLNNSYNNYNLIIGQNSAKDAKEAKKSDEAKEIAKQDVVFKGLDDETDLLTQANKNVYGLNLTKFTAEDLDLAESTNAILASLGFKYKVTAAQAASVSNGVKNVVVPGLKLAEDGAVAAHIQDPNGPFAELFA